MTYGTIVLTTLTPATYLIVFQTTYLSFFGSHHHPSLIHCFNIVTCGVSTRIADIIKAQGLITHNSPMISLCQYFHHIRTSLSILNKEHFSSLKDQQLRARRNLELLQQECQDHLGDILISTQEKEARDRYILILSSSMDLIKQQCKLEWIKYRDDSTRLFFAKAKQRKLSTYIYTLRD